jgi:hypothetical protein
MSYLKQYGSKRKFQEGGAMPADPAMAPAPAGPEAGGGGGGEEQIIMLAQAAAQGDQAAAAELGMMLAPMILEEAQAGAGGGQPQADPAAQPVFRKGGAFLGKR